MSLPLSVLALAEASPFLARLTRSPALADFDWIQAQAQALTAADLGQRLDRLVASGAPLATALRRLRAQTLAHLIVRDASGAASLDEVVSAISALARLAVQRAEAETRQDLIARFGTPRSSDGAEQHLQVVAMGKLGGGELNASSDIDLIFVYPEDGDTDGSRSIGNQEFFIRQGRALIGQLAEVTADGMVFRV
ncbi:MAG: bifunctional glutamine synthetase adenylyltransferase/deadenyltransferase, partial [Betaproteobacteria bacterium]|nr:bifunctional glutamine synthetase adenylyltransferase/deadenyltransferase [Betaproteobacteria bacterium]